MDVVKTVNSTFNSVNYRYVIVVVIYVMSVLSLRFGAFTNNVVLIVLPAAVGIFLAFSLFLGASYRLYKLLKHFELCHLYETLKNRADRYGLYFLLLVVLYILSMFAGIAGYVLNDTSLLLYAIFSISALPPLVAVTMLESYRVYKLMGQCIR
ncbi:MAG: hypothetical protein QW680_05855 [Pyrobaculum sp.]